MPPILDNFGKVIDNTSLFKYYAGKDSKHRPPASSIYITGDQEFYGNVQRQKMWNQSNDLYKNLSIMQFAIESHLDYITNYKFTARTNDKAFNVALEKFIAGKSSKFNVDVCRRLSIKEMARMFYMQKLVFGDSFCLKVKGGRLQLIDPQMITKYAEGVPNDVDTNGVILDDAGAVQEYSLTFVDKDNMRRFSKLVSWKNVIVDGQYPNPHATRGVSRLTTVLNEAQDLMDLQEYTLIKAKLQSIFGMAIFRDTTAKGAHDFNYNSATNSAATEPLNFKLQPGLKLSLAQADRVEFLESKTPNSTYEPFCKNLTRKILASLQIPYCMYDSEGSTYSANRVDYYKYKFSIEKDRDSFYRTLDEMYDYILLNGVLSGDINLPAGMTLDDIDWNYIPLANFVLDQNVETQAMIAKIQAGLMSPQAAMLELGNTDPFETVIDQIAYAQALQREKGVTISLATPGATTSQDTTQPPYTEAP